MDIIALFCDINHFLFLKVKQIVAYTGGIRKVMICKSFLG